MAAEQDYEPPTLEPIGTFADLTEGFPGSVFDGQELQS